MRRLELVGHRVEFLVASCVALLAFPTTGNAQRAVPEIELGSALESLPDGFTSVESIIELSDGRVIIADGRERRLAVADFASGAVRDIGRVGQGPGEFEWLTGAFPLGSDSVLIFDGRQRRALIVVGDQIVATISSSALSALAGGGRVAGADSLGFLLSTIERPLSPTNPSLPRDSILLAITHRGSGVADTVARIGPGAIQLVPAGGTTFRVHSPVLASQEEALLLPDGWLTIARLRPYRVDWRDPGGTWTYGSPLPFEEVDVDDEEIRSHRAWLAAIGRPEVPPDAEWPETMPPFLSYIGYGELAVLAPGPRGLLLIRRIPTADRFLSSYDVVDRSGALVARLGLAVNQRIVAVGERGVYVVSTDAFGLERVHRHATPALP